MAEMCQKAPDGLRMTAKCAVGVMTSIFNRNNDIRNYYCYRAMKFLEQRMKIKERVLKITISKIVTANKMQFVFLPEKQASDAQFMLRRLQESDCAKGRKLHVFLTYGECF